MKYRITQPQTTDSFLAEYKKWYHTRWYPLSYERTIREAKAMCDRHANPVIEYYTPNQPDETEPTPSAKNLENRVTDALCTLGAEIHSIEKQVKRVVVGVNELQDSLSSHLDYHIRQNKRTRKETKK